MRFLPLLTPVIRFLTVFLLFHAGLMAQSSCIDAPAKACLDDCVPLSFAGTASPNATFQWTNSCGTIAQPNSRDPQSACFTSTGNCKINLVYQEPGQAPQTCEVDVLVSPKPTAKFRVNDTICEGDCALLNIGFTGTPPFQFTIRANGVLTQYTSAGFNYNLTVCPGTSTTYEITRVGDSNCAELNPGSSATVRVLPPFRAAILRQGDTLCAFPAGLDYTWVACGAPALFSKDQCFVPPLPGCYCVYVDNGLCRDTVCTTFNCLLTCSFQGPDTLTVGDTALFRYTGNGSQNSVFTWILEKGGSAVPDTLRGDSIRVKYDIPGCFRVRLIVRDGPCEETCEKTICVVSKACRCDSYNSNAVLPVSSSGGNCCYELKGKIQSYRCFSSMQVFVSDGSFTNIQSNTAQGWSHRSSSNRSFYFVHNSGNLPPGNFDAGDFCVQGASNYTVTVHYYYNSGGQVDTCIFQYVFSCNLNNPKPQCDSSFVNYLERKSGANCCWDIRTVNPNSNIFTRMDALISNGSFSSSNPNVGAGFLISNQSPTRFTIRHNSGFIPAGNFSPAHFCMNAGTGPYNLVLRYYYNLPGGQTDSCSFSYSFLCQTTPPPQGSCCDSLKSVSLMTKGNAQDCCFDLLAQSTKAACFSKICVTSSSGVLTGVQATTGWTAQASPGLICFLPSGGTVLPGNIHPGSFCVTGTTGAYTLTVDFYDTSGNRLDSCRRQFVKICPPPPPPCSCDSLDVAINSVSSVPGLCCHDINYFLKSNQSKCFTSIKVTTSDGSFIGLKCPAGFTVGSTGSRSFNVTHGSGNLPTGSQTPAEFCVTGALSYTIRAVFYFNVGNQRDSCVYTQGFNCPAPKSCSCDSLKNNWIVQAPSAGKCCYEQEMKIPQSDCISSVHFSLNAGSFADILPDSGFSHTGGNQSFVLTRNSGFFPAGTYSPVSYCVSGAQSYTITVKYFYDHGGKKDSCVFSKTFDCPPPPPVCNCDSLRHDIFPVSQNPGYCCYVLSSVIPRSGCFSEIGVEVSAGTFIQITPVSGWMVSGGNQSFVLTHQSGKIPAGTYLPASFCVSGATQYILTVHYVYDNGGVKDSCSYSKTFDCPASPKACSCDSLSSQLYESGSTPGKCCYDLVHDLPQSNCFTSALITTDGGSFGNVLAATGYQADSSAQGILLTHQSGYLPAGPTAPLSFCVNGDTAYTLRVKYYFSHQGKVDSCVHEQSFSCASAPPDSTCSSSDCEPTNRNWQNIGNVQLVYDMAVYECRLIVAGTFSQINSQPVSNIAAWDGHQWSALGSGINGTVRALAVHKGKLYAGGSFTSAGGNPNSNNVAAWDGSQWSNLDDGVTAVGKVPLVASLLSTPQGLVAAGVFDQAGANSPLPTQHIALWNDSIWSDDLNSSFNGPVHSLTLRNGQLVAGGYYSVPQRNIAQWDGTNWNAWSGGIDVDPQNPGFGVKALIEYDSMLIAGGRFPSADSLPMTRHIAGWNDSSWIALPGGDISSSFEGLYDFKIYENKLFAAGKFTAAGMNPMSGVAAWDGNQWISTLHPDQIVQALESYDSCGTQPCRLFSAGEGQVNQWICVSSHRDPESSAWHAQVRPNPAAELLYIDIPEEGRYDVLDAYILNANGQSMLSQRIIDKPIQEIRLDGWPQGVYILEIRNREGAKQRIRFVKM